MTDKTGMEEGRPGPANLKWALVLGLAILMIVVLAIISSKSLHVILNQKATSVIYSQPSGGSQQYGQ